MTPAHTCRRSRRPKAPSRSSPRRFPGVFSPASGRAFSSLFCRLSSGGRSQRRPPGPRWKLEPASQWGTGHPARLCGGRQRGGGDGGILLNGCRVGKDCLIGAGALATEGTVIPDGCLAYGSPAGAVRPRWMRSNTTGRTRCTIWPWGAAAAAETAAFPRGNRKTSGRGNRRCTLRAARQPEPRRVRRARGRPQGKGRMPPPLFSLFGPAPGPKAGGQKRQAALHPAAGFPAFFLRLPGGLLAPCFAVFPAAAAARDCRRTPGQTRKPAQTPQPSLFSLRLPPSSGERSQKLSPMRGKRRPTAPTTRPPLSRHRLRATSRSPAAQARGQPPQAQ